MCAVRSAVVKAAGVLFNRLHIVESVRLPFLPTIGRRNGVSRALINTDRVGRLCVASQVEMTSVDWQLSLKVVDQPKSTFHFPEMMPGDVPPGEYRVATLKQLVAAQLPDSVNDPDLIGQSDNPPGLYLYVALPCLHVLQLV